MGFSRTCDLTDSPALVCTKKQFDGYILSAIIHYMADIEKGQKIDLADTRVRKRRGLSRLERSRYFWPAFTVGSIALFAAIGYGFASWKGPGPAIVAAMTGSFALCLCITIRYGRFTHFRLMRARHSASRTERELERFIIVILRGIRLPLKSIKDRTKQLAGQAKQLAEQLPPAELADNSQTKPADMETTRIIETARSVFDSARDLDRLAQGLLRLGRLRKITPDPEWLDINAMVVGVAKELQPLIDQSGAIIQMKKLPPCLGDGAIIRQAFDALLTNAVQYLRPDEKGLVRIWGWAEKNKVVYCIEDNGVGIAADQFDKIFETFYRIDPSAKTQGLGLAVVRRIVQLHNGRLWLKSTPQSGSTFSVAFPTVP